MQTGRPGTPRAVPSDGQRRDGGAMRAWRVVRGLLAASCAMSAVLAGGCSSQITGRGSLAEESPAATPAPVPTVNAPPGTIPDEWAGNWSGQMDYSDPAV